MEGRVFEAAWNGNIDDLLKLIEDDPRILHTIALDGGENPLHTACLAGHLNIVESIVKLMPGFAIELNHDGFSPLHIASANGFLEIVRELVRVDRNLSLIKGKERRIPLHYAVIKGRVEVIRELLLADVDLIDSVTTRGETTLHLAVKNNQFEALEILLEHIRQVNKGDVVNVGDDQGNTILHLAVSRKQIEVVDLLLDEKVVPKGTVDLNSLNKRGLSPLDLLLLFQSEAGDREIEEILIRSGAKRANDVCLPTNETESSTKNSDSSTRQQKGSSPAKQLVDYFKYNNSKDSPSEVRNTLLVIAILLATATYQAVLSPPGGVWSDDSENNGGSGTKSHYAGHTVIGTHNPFTYGAFLFYNSVGFFTSLHMINVLTAGFPMRLELQISMLALITTYDLSMGAIAPNTSIANYFTLISIAMPFFIPIITATARNYANRGTVRGASITCTNLENV